MPARRVIFSVHAIKRMFERGISKSDVRAVLNQGRVIEDYPEDSPFPSRLLLGWSGFRPIHVVAADEPDTWNTIVITVYQPNESEWEAGFARRRL